MENPEKEIITFTPFRGGHEPVLEIITAQLERINDSNTLEVLQAYDFERSERFFTPMGQLIKDKQGEEIVYKYPISVRSAALIDLNDCVVQRTIEVTENGRDRWLHHRIMLSSQGVTINVRVQDEDANIIYLKLKQWKTTTRTFL